MRLGKEELIDKLKQEQKNFSECPELKEIIEYYINCAEKEERGFKYFEGDRIKNNRDPYDRPTTVINSTVLQNPDGINTIIDIEENKISIQTLGELNGLGENKVWIEKNQDGTFKKTEESIFYEKNGAQDKSRAITNTTEFTKEGLRSKETSNEQTYKNGQVQEQNKYIGKVVGNNMIASHEKISNNQAQGKTYLLSGETVNDYQQGRRNNINQLIQDIPTYKLGEEIVGKYVNTEEEMQLIIDNYHLDEMTASTQRTL